MPPAPATRACPRSSDSPGPRPGCRPGAWRRPAPPPTRRRGRGPAPSCTSPRSTSGCSEGFRRCGSRGTQAVAAAAASSARTTSPRPSRRAMPNTSRPGDQEVAQVHREVALRASTEGPRHPGAPRPAPGAGSRRESPRSPGRSATGRATRRSPRNSSRWKRRTRRRGGAPARRPPRRPVSSQGRRATRRSLSGPGASPVVTGRRPERPRPPARCSSAAARSSAVRPRREPG